MVHFLTSSWFSVGVRFVIDTVLWYCLFSIMGTRRKYLKAEKQMTEARDTFVRLRNEYGPLMVTSLEKLATSTCPLCAVAAGEVRMQNVETENPADAEAEVDGYHVVHDDGDHRLPCPAALARAGSRKLVAESFPQFPEFPPTNPIAEGYEQTLQERPLTLWRRFKSMSSYLKS